MLLSNTLRQHKERRTSRCKSVRRCNTGQFLRPLELRSHGWNIDRTRIPSVLYASSVATHCHSCDLSYSWFPPAAFFPSNDP